MYREIMRLKIHVLSDHGRTVPALSDDGKTVHVLSDPVIDSSCTVRSWD